MADAILGTIVQTAAGLATNLEAKEESRLYRLKENIVWIENEMGYIQSFLKDAEGMKGVAPLMIDIWDLAYDVEEIMEKYFPKITSIMSERKGSLATKRICYNNRIAHDFDKEIKGIRGRVERIKNSIQAFGIKGNSGIRQEDTWDARQSFPHVDEPNVVGLEKQFEELVGKLVDEDLHHRVVSIIGMAGLGKTTLAKKVYYSVRHHFQCLAWIHVSRQPNNEELLREIARQVGFMEKLEDDGESNLFAFLRQKRYVIVIDDIWQIATWDALKKSIPNNSENGSRILLTSRNKDVVEHVGGLSCLHEMQPLDLENSRKLMFKMIMASPKKFNEKSDLPPQLENVVEQILGRCSGVPLAIVVAAGLLLLRERSENAWKGILESMGQNQDQCSEIFALSYKDLPAKLKPCFLYIGLFPKDYEISAFQLINLWAAEGFIGGSGLREVEDVGDDYLNHLIARNLIQVVRRRFDGKVRSFRIHDILHDLCIREAKEINCFNNQNENVGMGVRRVTTHGSNFSCPTPKLRALLCFNGDLRNLPGKAAKAFFRHFKFLRVLSIKCDYLPTILPYEVGNLNHLHYFGLGSRMITSSVCLKIPHTISDLKGLLTFDVQECHNGVTLPNVIWNMKQLRHILLPVCCNKVPSFCGVNLDSFHQTEICLPNLQTLYGLTEEAVCDFSFLHKLANLRKLRVNYWSDRIVELLSDQKLELTKLEKLRLSKITGKILGTWNLSRYENLLKLHLEHCYITELPHHDKMPPNLTKLTLIDIGLRKDPMEALKELPKLKILILCYNSYRGKKMVCPGEHGSNFPQLEVLKIVGLETLEELKVEENGMPILKEVSISGCNVATKVPERITNILKISTGWKGEGDAVSTP